MIKRYSAAYVDGLSAEHGFVAALKWFFASLLLQAGVMVLSLPLMGFAVLFHGRAREAAAIVIFLLCFLLARVAICAIPVGIAGDRKRLGPRWLWTGVGLLLGQVGVGLIAALKPAP